MNHNILTALEIMLPNKISTSQEVLQKHSDNLFYIKSMPDAVCFAENEEDVVRITDFCITHKIPLIAYGAGTSVEGHTAAIHGGICLNLSKMNHIIDLNLEDQYIIVGPGIAYNKLNDYLLSYGYHFPVEAGWGASIGGMTATNASGAGAVDAGPMSKNVMGCSIITSQEGKATKIQTGSLALKSSAGYNLTHLVIGSEGTLGIITEIRLKIRKNFSFYHTLCCQFDDLKNTIDFVIAVKGLIQFRKIELLDALQTDACIAYSSIKYLSHHKYTLIIELAGHQSIVLEEVNIALHYIKKYHGINLKLFKNQKLSEEIWQMRKNACPAAIDFINKNKKAMATDSCVPISKLAECITACYAHMNRFAIKAPLVAHVGDGNFHFTILVGPNDPEEMQKAIAFNQCIVEETLKVGGTCTGEHGIGLGKKAHLARERKDNIMMMKKIKDVFDPDNIFNPGKIF